MNVRQQQPIDRRGLLRGGMLAGAAMLAGCATPGAGLTQRLPGPIPQGFDPLSNPPPAAPPAPPPVPGVSVIARSAWTTEGPRTRFLRSMGAIERITVHHDGMGAFSSTGQADAARRIEAIRRAHLTRVSKIGEPWADIGYHFVIDPAGRIWEGRAITHRGAHVEDQNEHNVGIVMLGNYDLQSPSATQTGALQAFIAAQARAHRVPVSRVFTHQELGRTACPGNALQRFMVAARSTAGGLRTALA